MQTFRLQRLADTAFSTSGIFTGPDGSVLAHILERGAHDSQHPRIQPGTYRLKFHGPSHFDATYSAMFGMDGLKPGMMVEVVGVPGRTAILVHCGNGFTDSLGCLLAGTSVVKGHDGNFIIPGGQSHPAFHKLWPILAAAIEGDGAELMVVDPAPGLVA